MSQLKTILRGAGWVFAGMIASKVLTYAWRLLIARQGPELYGLVSLGIAVLSLATVLATLGLREGVARFAAYYLGKKDDARIKGVITSTMKFTAAASLILAALMFLSADYLALEVFKKPEMAIVLKVFAFALPAFAMREILVSAITALQRIEYVVASRDVLDSLFKIALAAVPILLGWGLLGLSAGYAVALGLTTVVMLYFLEKKVFPVFTTKVQSIRENKELFTYSVPLFLGSIMSSSMRWLDTLFLGVYKTAADVGIYNAAAPTAMLLMVVPTALLSLFLSIITAEYAQKQEETIRKVYRTVSRWVLVAILPMFLLMAFFPTTILTIFFGVEYAQDGRVLVLLASGYFIFSIFWAGDYILNMLKKTKAILAITLVGLAANFGLNWVLVPAYGSLGAATAAACSLVLSALMSVSCVRHYSGMFPFGKRAALAAAASAIVFYAGQQLALAMGWRTAYQLVLFGVLCLLYAGLVWKLRLVEPHEVEYVKNYARKVLPI